MAMVRGSGDVLAEVRWEDDKEVVEENDRRRPARVENSGGGEGEVESIEMSESSESEGEEIWEGAELRGELVVRRSSIVPGRSRVEVAAGGTGGRLIAGLLCSSTVGLL